MHGSEVRRRFLDFFAAKGHTVVGSSSLLPAADPTLLFTNAGMNQFKDVFLGADQRSYKRATSSQKCLRVSGKHNDLEEVGRTPRHHTFFEMLGNFSFGDYFKKEAIAYAWELLTEVYGIDRDRLVITVFGGSERFEADEEAAELWRSEAGVAPDRILGLGEKDNFWRMGETGPCGPCSEIHVDQGDVAGACGRAECDPSCECDRYLEIWNLVFMQFNQRAGGKAEPLPAQSVDTGAGLERLAAVLQGKISNYDSDLFQPLLQHVAGRAGRSYGEDPEADVSLRVISDHLRSATFLLTDGVVPSNEERGYVLRRILRRAMTHARLLGQELPFVHGSIGQVVEMMGEAYPELRAAAEHCERSVRMEEERFRDTIQRGETPMRRLIEQARSDGSSTLRGEALFPLYDSQGVPLDLMRAMATASGLVIDESGFESEMSKQRERARSAAKAGVDLAAAERYAELASRFDTEFVRGEERVPEPVEVGVTATLRGGVEVDEIGAGEHGEIVLDRSPFYFESGGQIGDQGRLAGNESEAIVTDTVSPAQGLVMHRVEVTRGRIGPGDRVVAQVDGSSRLRTMRNHTATHLLHAALREVLGTHATQAGSYVGPDRLRFDFNHPSPMTPEEIERVESLVNEQILANTAVQAEVMAREAALDSGAIAFFGEKYGDEVRVVAVPGFSRELCGGTHCHLTGDIGVFRVVSERGIAAGVRRIEALTGEEAAAHYRRVDDAVRHLGGLLRVSGTDELSEAVEKLLDSTRKQQREIERLKLQVAQGGSGDMLDGAVEVDGVRLLATEVAEVDKGALRTLADNLRQRLGEGVVVLGTRRDDRASLLVAVSKGLTDRLHAGHIVRELAGHLGGKGGGRPDLAEAGGKDAAGLPRAIEASPEVVRKQLEG